MKGGVILSNRNSYETVQQAIDDFDAIKDAIIWHRIQVPRPTPTKEYASLIKSIRRGGISGKTDIISSQFFKNTKFGINTITTQGRVLAPIIGNAEDVPDEDGV